MKQGKIEVVINYRSGIQMRMHCEEFKVHRNVMGALIKVDWKDPDPKPMHLGLEHVESIWRVK